MKKGSNQVTFKKESNKQNNVSQLNHNIDDDHVGYKFRMIGCNFASVKQPSSKMESVSAIFQAALKVCKSSFLTFNSTQP